MQQPKIYLRVYICKNPGIHTLRVCKALLCILMLICPKDLKDGFPKILPNTTQLGTSSGYILLFALSLGLKSFA